MTDPKPIETRYAGCRFRSRTEARWAVFFDHLGIRWQYESEGFELSTGQRYLPDFYLPDLDQWVEVKGKLSHPDFLRIAVAATELPTTRSRNQIRPGILVLGSIPKPGQPYAHSRLAAHGNNLLVQQVFFTRRSDISEIAGTAAWQMPAFLKSTAEFTEKIRAEFPDAAECDDLALHPIVDDAYRAARSARFEHGESGYVTRSSVTGEALWAVRVTDPYEVHPVLSRSHGLRIADQLNDMHRATGACAPAVVVPWPGTDEEHALALESGEPLEALTSRYGG